MAGFLYFVPTVSLDLETWPSAVRQRLEGAPGSPEFRRVVEGPGGVAGQVVAVGGVELGYYPERQEWWPAEGWQLGWYRGELPGPEVLRREDRLHGRRIEVAGGEWYLPIDSDPVTLGDGCSWYLPILGPDWARHQTVPMTLQPRPAAGGGYEGVALAPLARYRAVCAESEYWHQVVLEGSRFDRWRFLRFAADCLACNYRVGVEEVAALELISTSPVLTAEVLLTVTGAKRVLAALEASKKNTGSRDGP